MKLIFLAKSEGTGVSLHLCTPHNTSKSINKRVRHALACIDFEKHKRTVGFVRNGLHYENKHV